MSEIAAQAIATPETTFALRATACPQSGKGRAIAKRQRNSAAFWREGFETVCFESFKLQQALKQTRSVCLRAI
jgi:hypothetical protein